MSRSEKTVDKRGKTDSPRSCRTVCSIAGRSLDFTLRTPPRSSNTTRSALENKHPHTHTRKEIISVLQMGQH